MGTLTWNIFRATACAAVAMLAFSTPQKTYALPAPDANSVLILDSTDGYASPSAEASEAAALGYTVVTATDADWAAMTAIDFQTYRALILGDPTCGGIGTSPWLNAALANRSVWSPTVNGNMVIVGTDPVFHSLYNWIPSQGGDKVTKSGIAFAASEPGKTGMYITLSCYYHDTAPGTVVPLLDQFGTFSVTGVGCYNDAHIVAVHPALAGLTDASLSNWSCSVHEAFDSFPPTFLPLAIAKGIGGSGSLSFADGSFGIPYIIARGKELSPIACGNAILESPEECDDGNVVNGDGCSAQCTIEVPVCGDGTLDLSAGEECDDGNVVNGDGCSSTCKHEIICGDGVVEGSEQCDDGNTANGDGCSATCTTEVVNNPPDCSAATASRSQLWPPNHVMIDVGIDGVTDADGDPLTILITSIYQDEPTNGLGDGDTSPDGAGVGSSTASLRSERAGTPKVPGNGRVYHVSFSASDGAASCNDTISVCVPHSLGKDSECVDGGPLFDSTLP